MFIMMNRPVKWWRWWEMSILEYISNVNNVELNQDIQTREVINDFAGNENIDDINFKDLDVKTFIQVKKEIINDYIRLGNINDIFGVSAEAYETIINKMNSDNFNVVILGEFSRGKSTFVNALLGAKILPMDILPTTAVLTRVFYGEQPKIILHYYDGTIKEIEVEELKECITCLNDSASRESAKIACADIYYPSAICRNSCAIVDTPGVNDINNQNTDITYGFIPQSDAVIMLLDPNQPFSLSEKTFLKDKILNQDITKIFFVMNKSDLIKPENKQSVMDYTKSKLMELDNISADCVKMYTVSSKKTLISKIRNRPDSYTEEFAEFESDLMAFLVHDKGRYVLYNAIRKGLTAINDSSDCIGMYIENLDVPLEALQKKYEDFIKVKADIQQKRAEVLKSASILLSRLKRDSYKWIDIRLGAKFDEIEHELLDMPLSKENAQYRINATVERIIRDWIGTELYTYINRSVADIHKQLMSDVEIIAHQFEEYRSKQLIAAKHNDFSEELVPVNTYSMARASQGENPMSDLFNLAGSFGVGVLIASLIGGPLSIVAAFLGGRAAYGYLENNKEKRELNTILLKISDSRNEVTCKIQQQMSQMIDSALEKSKTNFNAYFDDILNNYEAALKNIISEKKTKVEEISQRKALAKDKLDEMKDVKAKFEYIASELI